MHFQEMEEKGETSCRVLDFVREGVYQIAQLHTISYFDELFTD